MLFFIVKVKKNENGKISESFVKLGGMKSGIAQCHGIFIAESDRPGQRAGFAVTASGKKAAYTPEKVS